MGICNDTAEMIITVSGGGGGSPGVLPNNTALQSRNAADTATFDLIRFNSFDIIEIPDNSGTQASADFTNRYLVSSTNIVRIDWENAVLKHSTGAPLGTDILNWESGIIADPSAVQVQDLFGRTLGDNTGAMNLDYSTPSAVKLASSLWANAIADLSGNSIFAPQSQEIIDTNGSLVFGFDPNGPIRTLYDEAEVEAIAFKVAQRTLMDATGVNSLDFSGRFLLDAAAVTSFDYGGRVFYDESSAIVAVFNSTDRTLRSVSEEVAIDFLSDDRILFNKVANIAQLNADPGGVVGDLYYNVVSNKLKVFNGSTWETVTSV